MLNSLNVIFILVNKYVMSAVMSAVMSEYCPPNIVPLPDSKFRTARFESREVENKRRQACKLQRTADGSSAGLPSNFRAKCKYDDKLDEFYQLITWDPPNPTNIPVSRYRVKIEYGEQFRYCFHVNLTRFRFYRKSGLRYMCQSKLGIVAQPVGNSGTFAPAIITESCPEAGRLKPLGSVLVPLGQRWSFKCRFQVSPIPDPNITWYFSRDKNFCTNLHPVTDGKNYVHVSANRSVLVVSRVMPANVGCYVVSAYNGYGSVQTERGFLDIKPSENGGRKGRTSKSFVVPVVAGTISALTLLMIIAAVRMSKSLHRRPNSCEGDTNS